MNSRGTGTQSSTSAASTLSTTVSAEMTNRHGHRSHSHRERISRNEHSHQSSQQGTSHHDQSQREAKKEQRAKRAHAIKEAEKYFIHLTTQYIVGESDGLNLPGENGCGMSLKNQSESLHAYIGRVNTMVYHKLYNRLMHQSQSGSSYSFNKRTSGNAVDGSGLVFMKDLDIDHITKQAISNGFRKLQSAHHHSRR